MGIEEKLPAGFLLSTVEQLAGYIQSAQARPDSLAEGLAQLRRGALEPA